MNTGGKQPSGSVYPTSVCCIKSYSVISDHTIGQSDKNNESSRLDIIEDMEGTIEKAKEISSLTKDIAVDEGKVKVKKTKNSNPKKTASKKNTKSNRTIKDIVSEVNSDTKEIFISPSIHDSLDRYIDIIDPSIEIWKDIIDFPIYEVSSFGRIRNKQTGKFLKASKSKDYKYPYITVRNPDSSHPSGIQRKTMFIHQIVSNSFISRIPGKVYVNHIDKNLENNHITNLRYVTRSEFCLQSRLRKDNKSGMKGVSYDKRCCKYHVYINIHGNKKRINIGWYENLNEAIAARKAAEEKYIL
jgi:hypothetical protein